MTYIKINDIDDVYCTVCIDNVQMMHITKMEAPYTDSNCVQIVYKDGTSVILFNHSDDFKDKVVQLYERLSDALIGKEQ